LINRWTKACAIYALSKTPGMHITNALIGQLFNKDKLLRNTASWLIRGKDKALHNKIFKRIEEDPNYDTEDLLIQVNSETSSDNELPAELQYVLFLRDVPLFKGVPLVILSEIMNYARVRKYETGVEVCSKGDYEKEFIMIFKGQLIMTEPKKDSRYLGRLQVMGGTIKMGENSENIEVFANEYSRVIHLEMYSVYQMMSTYREVKDAVTMNSIEINQNEFVNI
jgi:hypothetical protein